MGQRGSTPCRPHSLCRWQGQGPLRSQGLNLRVRRHCEAVPVPLAQMIGIQLRNRSARTTGICCRRRRTLWCERWAAAIGAPGCAASVRDEAGQFHRRG